MAGDAVAIPYIREDANTHTRDMQEQLLLERRHVPIDAPKSGCRLKHMHVTMDERKTSLTPLGSLK